MLTGATLLLKQEGLLGVIIETNGSGESYGCSESRIFDLLSGAGFQMANYDPWTRRLHDAGAMSTTENTLFVRPETELSRRLREAPPAHVVGVSV